MWLLIGFAIGMFYGCWLWWQALLQNEELYKEHLQTLAELMECRQRLEQGPSSAPSRN